MKLLETEIDETSVELTYADSDLVENAEKLLIVRMPLVGPETKSLAWHRLQTLHQVRDLLGTEMQRLKTIIDANS